MDRVPRGYVGSNHETVGSDILAVLAVVSKPEMILSKELLNRLRDVQPERWYPISLLLEVMSHLSESFGAFGLRKMGRELFRASHASAFKAHASSAADVVFGIETMYRRANRGDEIGGWQVKAFVPGRAVLDKTTPHSCIMEEGILLEALSTLGISALIQQTQCFRNGADSCVYELSSLITDARWMGNRHAPVEPTPHPR